MEFEWTNAYTSIGLNVKLCLKKKKKKKSSPREGTSIRRRWRNLG